MVAFASRAGACSFELVSEFLPVGRSTDNHRSWGGGFDAWELMSSGGLAVVAESMPPGTAETPHRHARANQFFYVLSGELTVAFGDRTVSAPAGLGIQVPAGTIHQARNDGTATVEFLAVAGPSNAGDRVDVDP